MMKQPSMLEISNLRIYFHNYIYSDVELLEILMESIQKEFKVSAYYQLDNKITFTLPPNYPNVGETFNNVYIDFIRSNKINNKLKSSLSYDDYQLYIEAMNMLNCYNNSSLYYNLTSLLIGYSETPQLAVMILL